MSIKASEISDLIRARIEKFGDRRFDGLDPAHGPVVHLVIE